MVSCTFPGCVVITDGGPCVVHATQSGGKPCLHCRGTGTVLRRLSESDCFVKEPCDRCAGVGIVDYHKSTRTPKAEVVPVDARGLIQVSEQEP